MAKCNLCKSFIFFAGKKNGNLKYCNENCYQKELLQDAVNRIPSNVINQTLMEIQNSGCPLCKKHDHVDVYPFYRVWSFVFVSSYREGYKICCRKCAIKYQYNSSIYCFFLGWWGGWGIVLTPLYIFKNIKETFKKEEVGKSSELLSQIVKESLAKQLLKHNSSKGQ